MKAFKILATVTICALLGLTIVRAGTIVFNQRFINETALAYNNTYVVDIGTTSAPLGNVDSLSMQAVYSSATIPTITFTDGVKSTGTVTISSYNALIALQGADTLSVSSTNVLGAKNTKFTLAGQEFYQGDLWTADLTYSSNTALNIANAINSFAGTSPLFSASTGPVSASTVTITCVTAGTLCNSYTLTTSTSTALKATGATFSGGTDNAVFTFGGVRFVQGTDFTATDTGSTTAKNLSNAIMANTKLNAVIVSTWTTIGVSSGVVASTSIVPGSIYNYGWTSSTATAMAVSNGRLYGGLDSAIASSVFTSTDAFTTGLQVLFSTTAGTPPQNLINQTTYYVIPVTLGTSFKLASTLANAQAGTAITVSTVTGSGTFTLAPLAISGTPSFKWQVSNDNVNWSDYTTTAFNQTIASVTISGYTAGGATQSIDFGPLNYRYIRFNVISPTQGGLNIMVTGTGKRSG